MRVEFRSSLNVRVVEETKVISRDHKVNPSEEDFEQQRLAKRKLTTEDKQMP